MNESKHVSNHARQGRLPLRLLSVGAGAVMLAISVAAPLTAALPVMAAGVVANASAKVAAATGSLVNAAAPAVKGAPAKPGRAPAKAPGRFALAPSIAASSSITPAPCTLSGTARSCDLWALATTVTLPGADAPVGIWGFSSTNDPASARIPGPTIVVNAGETLVLTLHNQLPAQAGSLSLEFPAVSGPVDRDGADTSSSTVYRLSGLPEGTYLYEAGPTNDQLRQLRMGLSGLLIVRPQGFSSTAMTAAGKAFTAEALAEISEIDPEFNNAPFTFDPLEYHPTIFLLNGRSFHYDPLNPDLGIPVAAGDSLLLHYANVGSHDRGVTIQNHRQLLLANDSQALKTPADVATAWTTPGQVTDALVLVDPATPLNARIPVFESGLHLSNGPDLGLGGTFTYLNVWNGHAGVPGGPISSVSVSSPTVAGSNPATAYTGIQDMTFSGTITPTSGGVSAAEWFFDAVGAAGTGHPIAANTTVTGKSGTIAAAAAGATTLTYTVTAGPPPAAGDVFTLDTGASMEQVTVSAVAGTGPFTLTVGPTTFAHAAGTAAVNGGIVANQASFSYTCTNVAFPNFSCTIPAAALDALVGTSPPVDADHILWVHGQDAGGWGVVSGDVFTYNMTGPDTSAVTLHSTPTGGSRLTDVANGAFSTYGTIGAATAGSTSLTYTVTSGAAPAVGDLIWLEPGTANAEQVKVSAVSGAGPYTLTVGATLFAHAAGTAANINYNPAQTDLVILGAATASLANWVVLGGEYCIDDPNCAQGSGTPLYITPAPFNAPVGFPPLPTACTPSLPPPGVTVATAPDPGGGSAVSFCATIPSSRLKALPEGTHTVYIRACEAPNTPGIVACAPPSRWGSFGLAGAAQNFVIDRSGPSAGSISLSPNPNNGRLGGPGNTNFLDSLQVVATLDDSKTGNSNIAYAEVFVTCSPVSQSTCASVTGPVEVNTNLPPADGSGAEMIPSGAKWDSPVKIAYAYIPLAELTAYSEGYVRMWVHGQDLAGNFGPWGYSDLTLDRTPPTFIYTGTNATPANNSQIGPCPATAPCSITFTASDPLSGGVNSKIVEAEWFIDQGAHLVCEPAAPNPCTPEVVAPGDPGQGLATPIRIATPGTTVTATFSIGAQPSGTHIVFRVKDQAGNWSLDSLVIVK